MCASGCPPALSPLQTLEDATVTLRERDSMAQVRVKKEEVVRVVSQLADASLTWADVHSKYPAVERVAADDS